MKSTNSLHRSYAMPSSLRLFLPDPGRSHHDLPFVWMILTSSKTVPESMQIPPTILPSSGRWPTSGTFEVPAFGHLYWNTTLMVIFRVICAILFSSMAGYASPS